MVAEGFTELALLAGTTVVAATVTDAWDEAKRGIARLLSHGNPRQEQLAERRLEDTRVQLAAAEGAELESARATLAAQWATRLADLLEDDPDVEAHLRVLVQRIQAELPPRMMTADDHGMAATEDTKVDALGGAIATRVIQGSVVPPNPRRPGPESSNPDPGQATPLQVLSPARVG